MYSRLIRNRLLIAIVCLIAAAVISFKIIPNYVVKEKELIDVFTAKKTLEIGDELVKGENVKLQSFNPSNIPKNYLSSEELDNKLYATQKIVQSEFILNNKCSNKNPKEVNLEENNVIVAIPFDGLAQGVANKVRVQDRISVIRFSRNENKVKLEESLKDLLVLDIVDSVGNSLTKDTNLFDGRNRKKAEAIVFSCSLEQAISLVTLEKTGEIHFILTNKINN